MWCKFDSGNYGMLDNEDLKIWTLEDLTDGEDNLMQFTGLLDKTGKEIYEGDILEVKAFGRTYTHVVEWDEKDCCFCTTYYDYQGPQMCNPDYSTVIGNKYENPELIPKVLEFRN